MLIPFLDLGCEMVCRFTAKRFKFKDPYICLRFLFLHCNWEIAPKFYFDLTDLSLFLRVGYQKLWDNFGTTLRQFWQSYGTTLGPHSNYLETILAKLWDHIVTIGGAYPCPVGGIWAFLYKLDDNCDTNRIVVHVVRSPGVSQTWCLVVEQTSVETSVVSVTIPGFWAVFCIHRDF